MKTKLIETSTTCDLHRCGRTDAGVSASQQVLFIATGSFLEMLFCSFRSSHSIYALCALKALASRHRCVKRRQASALMVKYSYFARNGLFLLQTRWTTAVCLMLIYRVIFVVLHGRLLMASLVRDMHARNARTSTLFHVEHLTLRYEVDFSLVRFLLFEAMSLCRVCARRVPIWLASMIFVITARSTQMQCV